MPDPELERQFLLLISAYSAALMLGAIAGKVATYSLFALRC